MCKEQIGVKTIEETMFKLVELVEEKMNNETKAAPIGTIMHDGWTRFLIHCLDKVFDSLHWIVCLLQ